MEASEGLGEGRGPSIAEGLKKLFTVGVGAAFLTEEAIRKQLGEFKLPREVLSLVLQGANKSKEEIVNRVSRELTQMLSKIDLVKEASKFAETHKFKISAEIEILPKKDE
ncbi:MAG: hypothetical protein COT74_13995 [Bdellovibrionales bacterium CG10_big_fil_rev_8_21_14_0_10_45_34]|nr:MAG: hypothetical protein COT74_13995 [Bdellovibrionales bacterium CG10_big_fil_rev_8_21_14_0_10_45_34]